MTIKHINIFNSALPNRINDINTGSKHWYISYNNHDINIYGSATTALVIGEGECFLLLIGDHREALSECIKRNDGSTRLVRCLNYIRDNKHIMHSYSCFLF